MNPVWRWFGTEGTRIAIVVAFRFRVDGFNFARTGRVGWGGVFNCAVWCSLALVPIKLFFKEIWVPCY